ncbi:DUF456 domain-containing protein [Flavobacterium aurantiibacter]|uniref:DUF456 domain-containing protein n=1 Tax=Flavobacterium aurantiibacter TaxID=2023067 RepID=A0A255ZAE9_9FLAO|nr:DUF456 domain-containing protein [Flavobacterium aurantiibacter]OYQ38537.1 hypothetical protein CHX27_14825 [Flavobacterium aurantiibacter]
MDIFLVIAGFVCCLAGIVGSVLPALPGVSVSWIGLLLLHFTSKSPDNYYLLTTTLVLTLLISFLDYYLPSRGTKAAGGSRYAVYGTNVGLLVGILFPIPLGFLIGPFLGAFLGEFIFAKAPISIAIKAAFGSFIALMGSMVIKVLCSILFLVIFVWKFYQYDLIRLFL